MGGGREGGRKNRATLGEEEKRRRSVGGGANRQRMMTDIMEWTALSGWEGINKQEWVNSALRASRRTAGEGWGAQGGGRGVDLLKSAVSNHPVAALPPLP